MLSFETKINNSLVQTAIVGVIFYLKKKKLENFIS